MDVKSAFLNGTISEEVYVNQPPGFESDLLPSHVFKLKKALYGLKQAPQAWYDKLSSFLTSNNFIRGNIHSTLFRKEIKDDFIIVKIYVDDIIFGATNDSLCQKFSKLMQDEFEMSMMGELKSFLGLQIVQSNEGIKIHQMKYTKEILKKYKMDDAKPMKTPMHPSTTLGLDEDSPEVDSTMYRGIVGSLLYLTTSRPDIMFSVYIYARFQVKPKEVHLQAVKRILRYIKGTTNLGISFYRRQNFTLLGYYDADYAGDKWERKSTSEGCHFLDHCLVSWTSKRQSKIALSTSEAEYVAARHYLTQLLWIKHQLEDYDIYESSIPVLCDNTAAINISKTLVLHSRTKHIKIKHHFIRDHVQKGTFNLIYVKTEEQLANIFTKPFQEDRYTC
uniref:Retrovirus-related Pol polyprotein from transposon TNT 1-94 n=1 Tax=Cajanus cajan TaxID=3821 RepID=A0A151S4Q6_CAJCA|nr:Retrovirus-related Pol polyprotein from transposon TNT 1-94 [Cajanus cajan]